MSTHNDKEDPFEVAVRRAYIEAWDRALHNGATGQYMHQDVIDGLFAMPEMQAIRSALFEVFHPSKWWTADGPTVQHRANLAKAGLPESVIEWVVTCTSESTEP